MECNERRSLDDIYRKLNENLAAKLCPGQTLPENTPFGILSKAVSGLVFMGLSDTHNLFRSLAFIDDMCCEDLIKAAEADGLTLNPPTRSTGCVTLTGNAGAAIPSAIEFISITGNEYGLDTSASNPAFIGVDGTATVCLIALSPNSESNIVAGELDTVESYPDIDGSAVITQDGFNGGNDEESCEALRARYKERRQKALICGNIEWYIDIIRAYPGVTNVCVASCECSDCGGCCQSGYLRFYPFFDGYPNGIPPQSVLDDLNAYVFGAVAGDCSGVAPCGAAGEFLAASPLDIAVSFDCACDVAPAELESIVQAIETYLSANVCVGGEVCYTALNAAIHNAAPSLCPCNITIEGVGVTQNGGDCPSTASIPCGSLPILSQVRVC